MIKSQDNKSICRLCHDYWSTAKASLCIDMNQANLNFRVSAS